MRTVKEVAALTGVTVRALHHYDEIGLLRPSARTDAGYRLYDREDLERLQEILVHRALGMSLADIERLLDDPGHDRVGALRTQRAELARRIGELHTMVAAIDAALTAHEEGTTVTDEDLFDGFDPSEYEDEARERWGDTDAYRQSQERTTRYGKEDWKAMKVEADGIVDRFIAVKRAGEPADSEPAMGTAEAHRQHIAHWFYDCPPQMHAGLGEMYVQDPRFTAYWDDREPGLASYVRDAFVANAARAS